MPFDWTKFIEIAEYLVQKASKEIDEYAAFRCSVSRSYYGAYCFARNQAIANLGFKPETDPQNKYLDHDRVRKHYRDLGKAGIADKLDSLRRLRNCCDYDDEVDNLKNLPKYALMEARVIFNKLQKGSFA